MLLVDFTSEIFRADLRTAEVAPMIPQGFARS